MTESHMRFIDLYFTGGAVVLPDRLLSDGFVWVVGDTIQAVGDLTTFPGKLPGLRIDLQGGLSGSRLCGSSRSWWGGR